MIARLVIARLGSFGVAALCESPQRVTQISLLASRRDRLLELRIKL